MKECEDEFRCHELCSSQRVVSDRVDAFDGGWSWWGGWCDAQGGGRGANASITDSDDHDSSNDHNHAQPRPSHRATEPELWECGGPEHAGERSVGARFGVQSDTRNCRNSLRWPTDAELS